MIHNFFGGKGEKIPSQVYHYFLEIGAAGLRTFDICSNGGETFQTGSHHCSIIVRMENGEFALARVVHPKGFQPLRTVGGNTRINCCF